MWDLNKETIADPVKEARRYVDNAKKTLREDAKLNDDYSAYMDRKYVRAAGHYLWNAVLIMLEAVFHVDRNKRNRVDIDDYLMVINKRDKKLTAMVLRAYEIMHLSMGYDGAKDKTVCTVGVTLAGEIIDRCATMLPE